MQPRTVHLRSCEGEGRLGAALAAPKTTGCVVSVPVHTVCKPTRCRRLYSRSEIVVRRGKGNKTRVVKIGKELKRDLRW